MLLDTYNIKKSDLKFINSKSSVARGVQIRDYYINLASLIFSKTCEMDYSKEFALAQLTHGNMALAMDYDEDLEINERIVGGDMSRCFKLNKLTEEKRLRDMGLCVKLNNMHMLRKAAYKKARGKTLEANVEETIKAWGDNLEFSLKDLLLGINIPPKITSTIAFLLGVHQVDASGSGYNVTLSGEGDNTRSTEEFKGLYEAVVYPIMNTLFKVNGHSNFKRGKISIDSQVYSGWLKEINFGKKDFPNWEKNIRRKNRSGKKSELRFYDKTFFYGMLAGGVKCATKKALYPFTMHDSKYTRQFAKLARQMDIDIVEDKTNERVYIKKEGVEKMMKDRINIKANSFVFPHIGGFYNPKHIDFLCKDYVKQFYVSKRP